MVRMIGAMPAVAVRQQRKHVRHEDHKQRPSTLTIDQPTPHHAAPPKESPHQSPAQSLHSTPVNTPKSPKVLQYRGPRVQQQQQQQCGQTCVNGYLFGHISLLHISVICVILGVTLLVVGLIQLAPGANSEFNKYAIIGTGTGFLAIGFIILIILCACSKNTHRKRKTPAHLLQKQAALAKSKSVSSKGNNKGNVRTPTRQAQQVQTINGTMDAKGSGRYKSGVHPMYQTPVADMKVLNEKDASVEAFVKSPSESDALLQQNHRCQ